MSFLSEAAEYLFEGQLDEEEKRERIVLIKEIISLASKPGELSDNETIRFLYAKYKLDARLESDIFPAIDISAETEELFAEEIGQFHAVIQLGKIFEEIHVEFPKVISEESVTYLKSVFAEIKYRPGIIIRDSVPQSLVDSLTVFQIIFVDFTNKEAAEISLTNLKGSNSILDLPPIYLDFQFVYLEHRFQRMPVLVAELFGKLGIDVNFHYSY